MTEAANCSWRNHLSVGWGWRWHSAAEEYRHDLFELALLYLADLGILVVVCQILLPQLEAMCRELQRTVAESLKIAWKSFVRGLLKFLTLRISSCEKLLGWPLDVMTGLGEIRCWSGGGGRVWICWMWAGADGPEGPDGAVSGSGGNDENLILLETGTRGVTSRAGAATGAEISLTSQPTFLGQSHVCSSWLYISPPVQLSNKAPPKTQT